MPTQNQRFLVTVNPEVASSITSISKKHKKSISGVIFELINEALDLREDLYWSKLAEEADKRAEGKTPIPAEVLWKELGLE